MRGPASPPPLPSAREWWRVIEPVHAVTYFADESRRELAAAGLRGFWMAYFAARVAPVGPAGPSTAIATFFNFHPAMVRRSLPDAWSYATPEAVLDARRHSAGLALRRVDPLVEGAAGTLLGPLARVVAAADGAGRVLFGANRDLGPVDDPVESLWLLCTCLREHRGDGHVAALTAAGLDGCEALVLFALSEALPAQMFRDSRGWSTDEWEQAATRLGQRGLVEAGRISPAGAELRASIEGTTDELASRPFAALSDDEVASTLATLGTVSTRVAASGEIPFPNPMGLPRPTTPAPG